MYLTDKFGMSFYRLVENKFSTNLETHVTRKFKNDHGESYTMNVLKHNHEDIQAKIDKQYNKWLADEPKRNWYSHGMPRTPRETRMAQGEIDGVVGWWNIK